MKKKSKNIKKEFKKKVNEDPLNLIVPILSLLILIASSLAIGIFLGIFLFIVINGVYFLPRILKKRGFNMKKGKKIGLLILLCLFILAIIMIIVFFVYIMIKAPDFDPDKLYKSDPSVVLDVKGNEVAKLGTEQRTTISYDEVSENLVDAIIATEDSRFFEHKGVDWARFLKASFYQLAGNSSAGGASTLTMQLSKNNYTSTKASILRKFTDIYISMFKIEKKYTKKQIFEFYVNSHYLGNSAYGVEQASKTYFGKSAKDLNLSEAAMLAGLFQAPSRYNVYDTSENGGRTRAEARRKNVLKLMLRHGYIDKEEYNAALKLTIDKIVIDRKSSDTSISGVSKYQSFIDTLVDEIEEKTGLNPYTTAMTIYSTMDKDLQDHVTNIMNGETYKWENDEVKAGVAITNVKTGGVAAIGGGRNIDAIDTLNYATEIKNQIGSTAKPLYDYGPAIEYLHWSTYQPMPDEAITYSDGTKINNWNNSYEGYESIRTALAGSRNIPALKTFKRNNKQNIIKFVEGLGLSPEIYSCEKGYQLENKKCINKKDSKDVKDAIKATTLHEAHAIGGYNGESPLSMAAAYAAFANGGTYIKPYTFTELVIEKDNKKYVNKIEKNKAMSEETAYMISDMLVTTSTRALGGWSNINGIRYAAKTGTTNFDEKTMRAKNLPSNSVNDLWTIGYNTEYAIGVWYGYDPATREHHNILSSGQHNRLFNAVAKKAFTNGAYFTKPSGVVSIEVESECAEPCLPSQYTPAGLRQTELFIKGYEPSTVSERFAKLSNVSNLTSTTTSDRIVLSWKGVDVPKINKQSYLTEMFKKVFDNNSYLNSFVASRLNYINSNFGTFGYSIYIKDESGLKLLDFTTNTKYEYIPEENGEYTFVVKTSYSKYNGNASDGVTTKVSASFVKDPIIPEPVEPTEPENPDVDPTEPEEPTNN